MRNIYQELLRGLASGARLALATLVSTRGSTPQIPGASALFSPEGLVAGTLGGGLLESDAEQRVLEALRTGRSMMYRCDLTADISDAEGAICGGSAEVLIDVQPAGHTEVFRTMQQDLRRGQHGALLSLVTGEEGEAVAIERRWIAAPTDSTDPTGNPDTRQNADLLQVIAQRSPVMMDVPRDLFPDQVEGSRLYVEPAYPLPQLVIIGAGHVGRALAHYGSLLDFEVTVMDDRPELANPGNIPDADHHLVGDIGATVRDLPIRADSYIVIVTRGHRGDADALRQCIASKAAYIGMIGSRRKIEQMREKFLSEGWAAAEQFDRIHAPIGLDIDAKTVEEIGISIAAELVASRRMRLRGERPS